MMLKHKNKKLIKLVIVYFMVFISSAQNLVLKDYNQVIIGAQQFGEYLPKLKNRKVAIVTNQTGVINGVSIVDTLLHFKVNIKKIFGPEHGFRGISDAGEKVNSAIDSKTKLPVTSLYGSNKKPSPKDLKGIDVVIYDIQDLGVRFYTYISTLCYVMEACAENNKELIVLDRPNPNGFYIDGPVLKDEFKTYQGEPNFLGMHNVPLVYGMTCGEYAKMANAEGWLKNSVKCKLSVVACLNYDRKASYALPINPSPNIPNNKAVLLYPSLGLFEGTSVSLGRGTPFPFQVIGHPQYTDTSFYFIPLPSELSKKPKYVNKKCYGKDLREAGYLKNHPKKIELSWLINFYSNLKSEDFFEKNFNYHAGNTELQEQIKAGKSETEIRSSWQNDILKFKEIRKKYLLYKDFE